MVPLRSKSRPTRKRIASFDILEDRTVPATYQWTGAGANANWNTAANWTLISGTGTFPNAVGDVAQFTGAYTATQTPVLTSAVTVGEIDFGGPTYTGNFGVTLTKSAGGLTLKNASGPAVINVLAGGNTTTQTITIATLASGLVATSGGVTVNQNAANLNLTISVPIKTGSFAETAVVNAGTLLQNDNAATASLGPTSTFTVNNGGTLAVGATANFAVGQNNLGTGTITLNAGSTLKVNNANDPVLLQNNIVLGSAASVILANAPILFQGGTITLNGNDTLKVNSKTLTGTVAPVLTAIADTIVGSGSAPNKLTFGPLGTGTPSLGDVTFAGSVPLTITGHAIVLAGGTAYPGAASTTPTFTVKTPTTISSSLSGTVSALTIAGSSTLTLGAANTYVGGTNVSSGTLVLGVGNALPVTTSLSLGSATGNAIVDLAGNNQTVAGLTLGAGASAAGQLIGNSSTLTGSTLTFAGGTNAASTFAGVLQDALGTGTQTLSLAVSSGNLTLKGNNTYTGSTTITGGSLTVDGSLASPAGVVVAAGASLAGIGTIVGPVTTSGILSPGDAGVVGTLSTGNLTFAAGSTLSVGNIDADNDQVLVTGSADLGNAIIAIAPGVYTGVPGGAFTILHTTAGLLATPTSQPDGTILTNATQYFEVHYSATDVTLQYVQPAAFVGPKIGNFTSGGACSFTAQTTGYPLPSTVTEDSTDTLPSGVTFASGVFSGTPDAGSDGIYPVHLTVANGVGAPATQTFALAVGPIATVYVSNANFGLGSVPVWGQALADADLGTPNNQPAVFGVNAFATIADAVSAVGSAGTVIVNAGTYHETPSLVGAVTLELSGNVTLDSLDSAAGSTVDLGANTLTVGGVTGNHTLAGVLEGTGGLTKVGSDTLTLTGTETFSGPTTANAGTLLIDGSLAASSGVTVALGATLGGSGAVSNLTLGPGNVSLDLDSDVAYDAFAVAGSLNLAGATLNLSVGTVSDGDSFTIFSVAGADPSARTGTFVNLPTSGSTLTIGSRTFAIDYAGGDGNDVVLTAQPSGAGPTVVSTVLNGGIAAIDSTLAGNQHSMVENVVYSFSQAVSLSASDFTLVGLNGTTFVPTVNLTSASGTSSDTVWTVTFSGDGVNGATHSIGDGDYSLILSGPSGLSNTYDFFRLLGDMDGSGTVDTTDFTALISTFLRSPSDPLYLGADDFDGDSTIGTTDFTQFASNYLKSVPPLPG